MKNEKLVMYTIMLCNVKLWTSNIEAEELKCVLLLAGIFFYRIPVLSWVNLRVKRTYNNIDNGVVHIKLQFELRCDMKRFTFTLKSQNKTVLFHLTPWTVARHDNNLE